MARTAANTETKLRAAIKRGLQYKETQGTGAFVGRLFRVWLWLPRLLGGRPAPLDLSPAPIVDASSQAEIRPAVRPRRESAALQLDGYGELLDLVLRRLSRLEDAMNDLREGQARIEQKVAEIGNLETESSNGLPGDKVGQMHAALLVRDSSAQLLADNG